MHRFVCTLALLGAFASASAARADSFTVTFNDPAGAITGSAIIQATPNGGTSFLVNSITGTNIGPIIGVNGITGNDNIIYPSPTSLFDANGIGFYYTDNGIKLDVDTYQNANGIFAYFNGPNGITGTQAITVTLVPTPATTPEPSTLVLLGTGLLCAAGVLRRRLFLG